MKAALVLMLCPLSAAVLASDVPRVSSHDARVRYVTYRPDDVVEIDVRRGVVTRLVLEDDEKILIAGTGFASDCSRDELEWCIRADKDTRQVWVKPRGGATHNNLELATSKRDYSIRFNVLPDAPAGGGRGEDMYRVIFQYPVAPLPLPPGVLAGHANATVAATNGSPIGNRLAARPKARNIQYSIQILGGGELISPSLVFDDGRFTYFRFPNNREIPAPFVFGADQQESRVNFHIEGDLMVVHRIAPRFVLRLGEAVVGIWNDAYDADGVPAPSGTVAPDVRRDVK